jgi:hypothetical protein
MAVVRLHQCDGSLEVCTYPSEYRFRPAFPCLPVSDGLSLVLAIMMLTLLFPDDCLVRDVMLQVAG